MVCDLRETEVRKVIQNFLTKQKVKHYAQKGAGPDFLLEGGGAIEVKGKGFDLRRGLEQFIRYPLTYSKLEVSMSTDALDARTIFALHIIEKSLRARGKPSIGIYLVAKVEEAKYKVRVYPSSEDLFSYVSSKLVERLYIPFDYNLEESLRRTVNVAWNMDEELRSILEEEARSIMGYEVKVDS